MDSKRLIFVTGPTGCGKTTNAAKLAEFFGCEIVVDGADAGEILHQLNGCKGKVLVLTSGAKNLLEMAFPGAQVMDYFEVARTAGIIPRPSYWIAEDARVTEARDTAIAVEMGDYGHDLRVLNEVKSEREKQRAKGYDSSHDDRYTENELVKAANVYALNATGDEAAIGWLPWPWDVEAFRPEGRRADLIKAAALLVAEIERMDRAVMAKTSATIDSWEPGDDDLQLARDAEENGDL